MLRSTSCCLLHHHHQLIITQRRHHRSGSWETDTKSDLHAGLIGSVLESNTCISVREAGLDRGRCLWYTSEEVSAHPWKHPGPVWSLERFWIKARAQVPLYQLVICWGCPQGGGSLGQGGYLKLGATPQVGTKGDLSVAIPPSNWKKKHRGPKIMLWVVYPTTHSKSGGVTSPLGVLFSRGYRYLSLIVNIYGVPLHGGPRGGKS